MKITLWKQTVTVYADSTLTDSESESLAELLEGGLDLAELVRGYLEAHANLAPDQFEVKA